MGVSHWLAYPLDGEFIPKRLEGEEMEGWEGEEWEEDGDVFIS